jgi:prepilin-type N-terminal cleavage/methylation domain-containing protein
MIASRPAANPSTPAAAPNPSTHRPPTGGIRPRLFNDHRSGDGMVLTHHLNVRWMPTNSFGVRHFSEISLRTRSRASMKQCHKPSVEGELVMPSRKSDIRHGRADGFTLIEILVVMIIIGILAAIAIPVYLSQKAKGYDASAKSDLRSWAAELESYNVDALSYPATTAFKQAKLGVLTVAAKDTIRVSTANTFGYHLNTAKTAYCIVAVNPKGTRPWEYISSHGGLQPSSTFPAGTKLPAACSTTSY